MLIDVVLCVIMLGVISLGVVMSSVMVLLGFYDCQLLSGTVVDQVSQNPKF
jgi:hypothetical protein